MYYRVPEIQITYVHSEISDMFERLRNIRQELELLRNPCYEKTESPLSTDSGVISTSPRPIEGQTLEHTNNLTIQKTEVEPSGSSPNQTTSISLKYGVIVRAPAQDDHTIKVPIGSGKTQIPKAIYDKINWNSYTVATRKLLVTVFSRNVLATHTLTGKPSPAFINKPAKLCLDQRKVQDIIMEVSEKCQVKTNLIRIAITTKCADESRRMRLRREQTNLV